MKSKSLKDFQQCTLREDFFKLTARQLQRILQREDLKVSREEVVVQALFKWAKSSRDKQKEMIYMLSNIDFPFPFQQQSEGSLPCCAIIGPQWC